MVESIQDSNATMFGLPQWIAALQVISTVVLAAVWFRLRRLRLNASYPVLFGYVTFRVLRSAILLSLPQSSGWYFQVWVVTEIFLWVLDLWVLRELYSKVLAMHPGLRRLSGWVMQGALALGLFVGFLTILPKAQGLPGQSLLFLIVLTVSRCIQLVVATFLITLLAFLNWYPVPLPRNLVRHCFIFTAYFLAGSLGVFVRVFGGAHLHRLVDLFLLAMSIVASANWLRLNMAGEKTPVKLRAQWSQADETEALRKLESLSQQILQIGRK
jgi:hypothetical protein